MQILNFKTDFQFSHFNCSLYFILAGTKDTRLNIKYERLQQKPLPKTDELGRWSFDISQRLR